MTAPFSYASISRGPAVLQALGMFGDGIRRASGDPRCASMMCGGPVDRAVLEEWVPPRAVVALVDAGLANDDGTDVTLAVTIVETGPVLSVIPKHPWGSEVVYMGPDSAHLVEAVLRLAPRGDRAADLGTGSGLLAALIGSRYRTVVATDLAPSVTGAAQLTMALNRYPQDHVVAVCTTDVAAGLRAESFDLVAANAPWVPLAASSGSDRELYAHGGDTVTELPLRFLREGAALLRPGGVGITLALDVEVASHVGSGGTPLRPIADACEQLVDDGFVVSVLPTPFNREKPMLLENMQMRQPLLTSATHVAIVVARPGSQGDDRRALLVAAEALGKRWATRPVARSTSRSA